MAKVASFDLDHTKVKAPYVRLADLKYTPGGEVISKWDLRVGQPNREVIGTGAMHTFEHLLAMKMRDHLEGIVDVSPMGCRTGFYAVIIGEPEPEAVMDAFAKALADIIAHEGPVPAANPLECGNYRDHDLEEAKFWSRHVLEKGLHVQETILIQGR